MNHRFTAYLLLLIVSIIWGVAGPVIKFTLNDIPPLIFLTYRFAVSSIAAFVFWSIHPPRIRHFSGKLFHIILYSVLNVSLGLGLLFFGFDKTSSIMGTVISATGPILTTIAGALLLHEHVTGMERAGISIALFGTLLTVIGPIFLGDGKTMISSVEGNILIIASLLAGAGGAVVAKVSLRERISPFTLASLSFLIGFLTLLPITLWQYSLEEIVRTIASAPLSAHLGVWYMALLSGTLAYTLQNRAMRTIEVGEASIFGYLMPIWAAPLAVFWLGESLTFPFMIGGTIIAIGVVIAEYKRRSRKPKRSYRRIR